MLNLVDSDLEKMYDVLVEYYLDKFGDEVPEMGRSGITALALKRYKAGKKTYGYKTFKKTAKQLTREADEEMADFLVYRAIAFAKEAKARMKGGSGE